MNIIKFHKIFGPHPRHSCWNMPMICKDSLSSFVYLSCFPASSIAATECDDTLPIQFMGILYQCSSAYELYTMLLLSLLLTHKYLTTTTTTTTTAGAAAAAASTTSI